MRWLITLLILPFSMVSQTVTLSPIGNQDVSGIPITVEHYEQNYPNHSIASSTYNPQSTAGTSVGLSDDSNVGPFNIGFNFDFYGQTFSQFRICTNGFITFGDPSGRYSPGSFPNSSAPNGVVAAYWTDLYPSSGYYMRYQTVGTAPNRQLIVSAHLTYYSNRNAWVDYQIILFENTNKIQTTITSQGWTPTATQGVENHTGTLAATPPGRNLSGFNGAGTTYEYTPMPGQSSWVTKGTYNTNSNGQITISNTSNWDYRVTINTTNKTHILTDVDMNYLMYKKMFPTTISDWDFYTCDIDNSSTFNDDDIDLGYTSLTQGLNKYIFTQTEKNNIEANPTNNYYNTYPPTQTRTFTNENQFYIMGTGKHKTTINNLFKLD